MSRHVPYNGNYGLHEAETVTQSFRFRAFEAGERLRAFRWRGVQENLELFLEVLHDSSRFTVDLGGGASPFGLGSVVVDTLAHDSDGRKVPYHALSQLPRKAHAVISSHTLEHIPDLHGELQAIADVLIPGGRFLIHVPSFSCVRWRAGVHHSVEGFGDHVWTFGLNGTPSLPDGLQNYVEIDDILSRYFDVQAAGYCGDDSIFALCARRASVATSI